MNESSLYSSDVASFESRKLQTGISFAILAPHFARHVHFQGLGAVDGNPCPLAHNLSRENEVLEDLLVHAGESAAARPLLLDTRGAGGLAQHPALCNKDNMAVRELLLELTGQSGAA